jgi:hypothetical protein
MPAEQEVEALGAEVPLAALQVEVQGLQVEVQALSTFSRRQGAKRGGPRCPRSASSVRSPDRLPRPQFFAVGCGIRSTLTVD